MLSPTSTAQSGLVVRLTVVLAQLGASPEIASFHRLEVLANVAMVVPAGLLAALSFRRVAWQHWVTYGFVGSLGVELLQGLLLPQRQVAASDVVANTLGVLLGAGAVRVVLAVRRAGARHRLRARR